ncbi:MAG: GspH/FimT family pseudopilin [Rhodoferax sp.]
MPKVYQRVLPMPPSGLHGFSLAELLVVVAISSVLLAIAAPSFTAMVQSYRINAATSSMTSALELTRATAIQMNGNITIAKISGTACPTNQDWSCGWQVFQDTDADGTLDAGEVLVQTFAPPGNVDVSRSLSGASMTANRWGQLSGINAVGFLFTPTGVGVLSPATTTICMNSGGRIRKLTGEVTC